MMFGTRRSIGALLPLAILLLLALLTVWLDRTVELRSSSAPAPVLHEPDYVVDKFVLKRLSATGEARYVLSAARMTHYPDDDTSHLEQPRLVQGQSGASETHVSAVRGVVSANGREVKLYENVELFKAGAQARDVRDTGNTARNGGTGGNRAAPSGAGKSGAAADDVRVRTSYLRVIPDDDKADTHERVVIEQGRAVLSGTGMTFDNRYRKIELQSAVSGTFERKK